MIRSAHETDIEQILSLGREYDKNFSNKFSIIDYLKNDIYYLDVYDDNSIVVGFNLYTKMDNVIEILLIYVKVEYRQKHIATSLLNNIDITSGDRILLEVSVDNKPAINLYKKFNFVEINRRKGYYNGIDALVMEKVIK